MREASLPRAELILVTVAAWTTQGPKPLSVPSPPVAPDHPSSAEVAVEHGKLPSLSTSADLACHSDRTSAQVPGRLTLSTSWLLNCTEILPWAGDCLAYRNQSCFPPGGEQIAVEREYADARGKQALEGGQ